MKASDSLSRLPGLGAEMSAQYEELNQNRREQENSYDAIRTPNKNRISGAQYEELNQNRREQENSYDAIRTPNKNRMSGSTYEDLQPQKEESKYEKFTSPKGGKDSVYANSKMLSQGNVYVNTSFKDN
ncbi:uncharacterized protein LOC134234073 [Saccostrea cucullata]|uniref:uncharacterized protein LOC134234073 n=1 Tax=Saccostrea cuccullata TaxID=36930 RepID=UPI002ED0B5A3